MKEDNQSPSKDKEFILADAFFQTGDFESALDYYLKAASLYINDIVLMERIGDCYLNLNQISKSILNYEKALQFASTEKEKARLCNSIGYAYYSMENYSAAINFYQKAIAFEPESVIFYKNLQLATKKRKESYRDDKIDRAELKKNLDRARGFYSVKNNQQAVLFLKKASRIDPYDPDVLEMKELLKDFINDTKADNPDIPDISGSVDDDNNEINKILREFDNMIGLKSIKLEIKSLINLITINKMRREMGLNVPGFMLHMVFTGPPGTGKTTVARMTGRLLKAIGILKSGHLIEVDRSQLVAEYLGQTAAKTNRIIDKALDGVLFIDEAYALMHGRPSEDYGVEVIDTLLKRMEDDRDKLVVIVAGYPDEMMSFINANSGLKSRFTRFFTFNDFTPEELSSIFINKCEETKYIIDHSALDRLKNYFTKSYELRDRSFGNARFIRSAFEELVKIQSDRIAGLKSRTNADFITITREDADKFLTGKIENETSIEELFARLNSLIGLNNVKSDIQSLFNFIDHEKSRFEKGNARNQITLHSVFYGPPGTGKTTIARILGQIFKKLGLIKKGHLVEVDRSHLVGGFLGQTAIKTNETIDSALDGILFIDEAYSLASIDFPDAYGKEAIDILLKRMEDDRDRLIVIVAGYEDEMKHFLGSNPGLASRFNRYFYFRNYDSDELTAILRSFVVGRNYILSAECDTLLKDHFADVARNTYKNFSNGRYARNLFEISVQKLADRTALIRNITESEINTITKTDIESAIKVISSHKIS